MKKIKRLRPSSEILKEAVNELEELSRDQLEQMLAARAPTDVAEKDYVDADTGEIVWEKGETLDSTLYWKEQQPSYPGEVHDWWVKGAGGGVRESIKEIELRRIIKELFGSPIDANPVVDHVVEDAFEEARIDEEDELEAEDGLYIEQAELALRKHIRELLKKS